MIEREEWKDIEGYEGKYQVSNIGRVKNAKTDRILKNKKHRDGYVFVALSKCGVKKYFMVHRLVASAFIPNTDNLPFVNHKDENKENNRVDNLEWCTIKYNNHFGNRTTNAIDTFSKLYGKGISKYSIDGILISNYKNITEASKYNDTSITNISYACKGKSKTAKGFIWKYIE